jgi:hypothetical protein
MAGWKISNKAELRFKYGTLTECQPGGFTNTNEFRFQLKVAI